ncbi:MAG: hypothetical protein ABIJ08_02870 [Nanoarchaeota archaeon]
MSEKIKRHTAFKIRVKDLLDGKYVKSSGEWEPNYIEIDNKHISRVNLLGVVVSKEEENMVIDDGSGKISIRSFGEVGGTGDINIGDVVLVVGRPREFGNERYIVPEIRKRIEDKRWIYVRRLELNNTIEPAQEPKSNNSSEDDMIEETAEINENDIKDPVSKIIKMIKHMDSNDGADVQEVIEKSNINNSEKIIQNLLEMGEIFEIRPGRIKVLE